MPTIIQIDVQTGEITEREMTAEEITALPVAADPAPEPAPEISPVEKLQAFLQANPDVATLIGVSQ